MSPIPMVEVDKPVVAPRPTPTPTPTPLPTPLPTDATGTWLGNRLSDAFIGVWRKLWHTMEKDADGGAFGMMINAFIPVVPGIALRTALIRICVRFNDATWKLIGGYGQKIGDDAMGKINEGINKAISDARAEVDKARAYIETSLINPIKDKIDNELKPKLRELGINIDSLDANVRKAMTEVSNMRGNITSFDGKLNDFGSRLNSYDTTLKDLKTETEKFRDDVERRLKALEAKVEGKPTLPFELPAFLRGED